jgi:hypothetical protein
MIEIYLVGAGSLGSGFAKEVSRRFASLKKPLTIHIYDGDTVEERNIFSQEFTPKDIGKNKAVAIAEVCNEFDGITAIAYDIMLDDQNIVSIPFSKTGVIVDAVDNLKARTLLWTASYNFNVPVMHMSMDPQGGGDISWNFTNQVDTFPLSPATANPDTLKRIAENKLESKPPCELNTFRPLINNTVLAGVLSFSIFTASDSSKEIMLIDPDQPQLGPQHIQELGITTRYLTSLTDIKFMGKDWIIPVDWPIEEQAHVPTQEEIEELMKTVGASNG